MSADSESRLAQRLAPEDVRCGDFVTTLNEVVEVPSFVWYSEAANLAPDQMVRLTRRAEDAGVPYRVASICLPFVLVRGPAKQVRTLDLRQHQIVRLSKTYGKKVWKMLEPQTSASE
ncbi:hypothetical protein [Planctomicrobium piriforme]|nr:hypothetical protein [Planctomicrobium piriforme]